MDKEQVTLVISIVGGLLGVIIGFFLNFWNSNRIEKKKENRDSLKEHFSDLLEGALIPIYKLLTNIGVRNVYITGHWEELENVQKEQFTCLKAHYPLLTEKWNINLGELTNKNNLSGGKFQKQNEAARKFEEKISSYTKERLNEARINLPIRPLSGQEEINDAVIHAITTSIYSQIENTEIKHDFNKSEISDDGYGYFVLATGEAMFARAKNRDILETCKSIFAKAQNEPTLKSEATEILSSAKQIKNDFEFLKIELERIQKRGLISKNKSYKFRPNKQCDICKELFFTN
ncbi:MAG: hypothetical protein ABR886_09240 [Dehalococcoidales bacterium]|jgi:hypothetical protein